MNIRSSRRAAARTIPNVFDEKTLLKLLFGAMIRATQHWLAITVRELECCQPRAVREGLTTNTRLGTASL